MAKLADRVAESTSSQGTGPITLNGPLVSRRSFASSFDIDDQVYYCIQVDGDWEIGIGTLTSTTVLSRDSVLSSSNNNTIVNFGAGSKSVFNVAPSDAWTQISNTHMAKAANLSDLTSAATARTNLGLGTAATQNSNSISITGGSISGITDLAVVDGGTGASTPEQARTNLGAASIGDAIAMSLIFGGS